MVGTWMQQVAMWWLVHRLTGSTFWVGLVGFMSQISSLVLSPVAGVLADRYDRRKMLIVTQIAAMLQAFLLAGLVLGNRVEPWHLLPLSFLLGAANSFDMPIRQSFVLDMVEKKENLTSAISLNSVLINSSRLIGPSLAGIFLSHAGEGFCFLLNGVSFLAVIGALLSMKVSSPPRHAIPENVFRGLKDGFLYCRGHEKIRRILMLVGLISLAAIPYAVLLPALSSEVLQAGPRTYALLMVGIGAGALLGAWFVGSRPISGLEHIIAAGAVLIGLGLIALSLSRWVWLSLASIPLVGFGLMTNLSCSNTILQAISEDDKRGHVMSFYTVAFMGVTPFGNFLAGSLASHIGVPDTLLLGGICCILGGTAFAVRIKQIR